jgi:hypothetical protein
MVSYVNAEANYVILPSPDLVLVAGVLTTCQLRLVLRFIGEMMDFGFRGDSKYASGDLANISRSSGSTSRTDEQLATGIWGL